MVVIWFNRYVRELASKSKAAVSASKVPWLRKSSSRLQKRNLFHRKQITITLDDVAKRINEDECTNVMFMAGAGISTPSGIQDFRTPGTGLYYNLQKYNLPYPEAIFDIRFFHNDPRPFFEFAKELLPGKYVPNPAHFLPVLFLQRGKLLRMYTQNIDGLERSAGIPEEKLVEAHGTFATAMCTRCGARYSLEDIEATIDKSEVPPCHQQGCKGIIKPDIVFFGEDLPNRFYKFVEDTYRAQVLIVMGTSLEVMPFASLAEEVSHDTPRLLINREVAGYFGSRGKDVLLIGEVGAGVMQLVDSLGWTEEFKHLCKTYSPREE